jgi:hypothetical protein
VTRTGSIPVATGGQEQSSGSSDGEHSGAGTIGAVRPTSDPGSASDRSNVQETVEH